MELCTLLTALPRWSALDALSVGLAVDPGIYFPGLI
jgi:hypothetical protein